jgi:uncharacterized protein
MTPTREIEYRTRKAELTIRDDTPEKMLFGYAATFNSPSQDLGGYVEVLKPGCFTKTLAEDDQRAFYNHRYDHLLGRMKSGTLRLNEDATGLAFEIDLDLSIALHNSVYRSVKRGDLDGVSFGFYATQDEWSEDGKTNTVLEAQLVEISPVVFPAYLNGPVVEARSLDYRRDRIATIGPERLGRRPVPNPQRPALSLARARSLARLDD